MKNCLSKTLLFIISLLFLLTACKNPLGQSAEENKKVILKISANLTDVNTRVASASMDDEIAYYKSLSYTLTAEDTNSTSITLLSEYSYDELLSAEPEIEPGEWVFSLFADDAEKGSTILAAVCEKTISADDSFVEFQMAAVEGVTGSVKIKILYGSNYVSSNEDGTEIYPEFSFNVLTTKFIEGNLEKSPTPEFECVAEGVEELDGLYSNTYVTEYAVGKWIIQALYNEQIEASDIFYISPNLTTFAEFRAGRPVKFVNKPDYNENYGIDLPFYTIKGFQGRTLEAGDKLVIKISGYPDRDASLKVSSLLYEVSADDWNLLSLVSNNIEFKKDEYFTAKYYYIINDTKGLDNGVQFYYSGYDLPEELRINEFNIEFGTEEEFDKPVYTYYIGNRLAARIMGEKGEAYTLPVSTGLEDHRLLGWYDNPDFTGDPITEIAAEENTTDRTFFAKYNLAFKDFGDPGWRSASILLDVMNMSAPEPGQIITVKYSGKSNVTNNKCEFNTELGYTDDSNVWHRFENANCWTYFVLKENEDVELRFDIKVPEDFDPTTKNLAISMGARSNEDIILSDWNVSVEYCDIETAFVNNGITAVSDQDGIHFTIENTDVTDWIRIAVEDLETGISYNLNDTLASGEAISFDYPYVKENQIYNFQMAYVKVFEGETNETWLNKKVWIKAAGGVGEVDPTAYNNITISLSDDDSDGFYRYLKLDGFDEAEMLTMVEKASNPYFGLIIWAGEGWDWVSGANIYMNSDDGNFEKIVSEGKLDIVQLAEQMDNLSKLNDKGIYWAEFPLILAEDDYGRITLSGKQTEKTTFVPVTGSNTINYYVGGRNTRTDEIQILSNYILPRDTGLTDHKLIGWYDNPEFTGEPITKILAEENITDRNFYAKYEYEFVKYSEDSCPLLYLYFDELNLNVPKPGQLINLKIKGVSPVTVDNCWFYADLGYKDSYYSYIHNSLYTRRVETSLKENEEFELYFDLGVSDNLDINPSDFRIRIEIDYMDTLVLNTGDVTVELTDIETTSENDDIIAEALPEGIMFTFKNIDLVRNIRLFGPSEYSPIYDAVENSFVYPYVDANKSYCFEIIYVKESVETDYNRRANIWIKSIGGLGEFDRTAYDNISISLSDDESDGNYCRYLRFQGFNDSAIQEMVKNCNDPKLSIDTTLVDPDNTITFSHIKFPLNNESDVYNRIIEDKQINIFDFVNIGSSTLELLKNPCQYYSSLEFNWGDEKGTFWLNIKSTYYTTYLPVTIHTVQFADENAELYKAINVLHGKKLNPDVFKEFYDYDYSNLVYQFTNQIFTLDDVITEDVVLVPLLIDSGITEKYPSQAKPMTPMAKTSSGKNLTFTDEFLNLSSQSSKVTLEWTLNADGIKDSMDSFATEDYSWFYKVNGEPVNIEGKNIITINTPSDSGYITISVEVTNSNNEKIYYGSFTYLAYN